MNFSRVRKYLKEWTPKFGLKTGATKCPSDKILNPASGRCVSRTGKIGLKLLAKPKSPKTKCSKDKILNPSSGRCVSRTGKIGKALQKSSLESGIPKRMMKKINDKSLKPPVVTPQAQAKRQIKEIYDMWKVIKSAGQKVHGYPEYYCEAPSDWLTTPEQFLRDKDHAGLALQHEDMKRGEYAEALRDLKNFYGML